MRDFVRRHPSLIMLGFLLALVGTVFQAGVLLIYPLFLLKFRQEDRMDRIMISFFFILVMADRFNDYTATSFFMFLRYVATVIIFLMTLDDLQRGRVRYNKNLNYFLPFLVVSVIGLVSSPAILSSGFRTLSYFIVLLIIFVQIPAVVKRHPHFFLDLSKYGVLMALISLVLLSFPGTMGWFGNRARGVFQNPNSLGAYSLMFFILNSYLYVGMKVISKKYFILTSALFFVCIILSGSRTSLGSYILFAFFYFLNASPSFFRNFAYFVVFPLMVYVIVQIGYEQIILYFGLEGQLRLESIADLGGRLASWSWAWEHWREHMWFGRGLNYEKLAYIESFSLEFRKVNRGFNGTFNGFLGILMNGGIIGLTTFVLFLRAQLLRIKDRRIILPLILVLIVTSLLESWLLASLNFLTSLFFLLVVSMQTIEKKAR